MTVPIERDLDRLMTKPISHLLGVGAPVDKYGGASVPEVVEPEPLELRWESGVDRWLKQPAVEVAMPNRYTIIIDEHVRVLIQTPLSKPAVGSGV